MKNILLITLFAMVSMQLIANIPSFKAQKIYSSQQSQVYKTESALSGAVQKINKSVNEYAVFDLEVQSIEKHLKASKNHTSFNLQLGEKEVQLNVYLHDILSDDFKHVEQTENGVVIHSKPEPFTYRGYTKNPADENIVLTIRNNWASGFFEYENEQYFLTPVMQFDAAYKKVNSVVVYSTKHSVEANFECTAGKSQTNIHQPIENNRVSKTSVMVDCVDMAVAYDQGFKNLHGGAAGVQNIIVSRLNMVSNFYNTWFDIDYQLIELYETALNEITPENNLESCIETNVGCSDGTILDDFREWGEGQAQSPNFGSGFMSNPDVATFWTSRDVTDGANYLNVGYSHFAGICNDKGYNFCEDAFRYRGNEDIIISLWGHELAHTWNAFHVNDGSNYFMDSNLLTTGVNVSNTTVNSIAQHKQSRTCLSSGSCNWHCDNGVQDQDETGVDCGGADCADCPTCFDGEKNGNEIGVDCGGPDCAACAAEDCSGTLNFNTNTVVNYDPALDSGTATIQGNGNTVLLESKAWKAVEVNYTITRRTVIEFEFKSTAEGQIHGIGFDDNLLANGLGPYHIYSIYGNQGFCGSINIGVCKPYTNTGNWQNFVVPVGANASGTWKYLVLVNRDDNGFFFQANSSYRNIRIYEDNNGNQQCDVCTDNDNDTFCDPDQCPGVDDNLAGTACNDNDACTTGDAYDNNCNCSGNFADSDNDGVCDANDICANGDDNIDANNDGVPDACYTCSSVVTETNNPIISFDKEAGISISTNGKVPNGANVQYHAGQEIEMLDDFEVVLGAEFLANIAPCN